MRIRLRAAALALASIVHVAHSGCGTPGGLPPSPPEEVIGKVLTVAIRPAAPTEGGVETVTRDRCAKAGMTAGTAAKGGFHAGCFIWSAVGSGPVHLGGGEGAILFLFLLALPLVLAPAFAIVGAVFGGLIGYADSVALLPEERACLESVLAADGLHDRVLGLLHRNLGGIPLADPGTADAVLEVGAPGAVLLGGAGEHDPLQLFVLLPVRLIRSGDGAVLYEAFMPFRGDEAPACEWTRDQGLRFQQALESAAAPIARDTVAEIFRHHPARRERTR